MFKASIVLVLLAFGALAYGWVANNDAILYGSIVASAFAGLALLGSTRADRKKGYAEAPPPRAERPPKEPKERKSPAAQRRGAGSSRVRSDELTRQLEMPDDEEFFDAGSEPVAPFRPKGRTRKPPKAPAGAAWAPPDGYDDDPGFEAEAYEPEADYADEGYEEYAGESQSAAAADDFRSRLAAVLGTTGEQEAPPPPPAPAGRPRGRRPAPPPVEEFEEEDDYAEEPPPPPPPVRRGRRRAPEPLVAEEPEEEPDAEPDWIRIEDVPRIGRVTQPGGGFARADTPGERQTYRPRSPLVKPVMPPEEEAPPPSRRRRIAPAEATVRSVAPKKPPVPGKSAVTRVSGPSKPGSRAPREPEPESPPPRRGRPPKTKP